MRIGSWYGKLLSYVGRPQLLKSVMACLHIYWFASFLLTLRTILELNRVYRIFLWCGPDSLTAYFLLGWDDIVFLLDEGGLRVRDIVTMNKAYVLRHVWNIVFDKRCCGLSGLRRIY